MMTWNYRVFQEDDGDYVIREVFYGEDGSIIGCTADAVEPFGSTLQELAQSLEDFKAALKTEANKKNRTSGNKKRNLCALRALFVAFVVKVFGSR